jgi:DNA helicase-2/ATP-dependent DNA helicase PcrA
MDVHALLDDLTEPQRAAVTHTDGPLLVLAGPGSGKTRVITHRAVHLAATVTQPHHILAITFTNKAAEEMRHRIGALGIGRGMWTGTFHSLCARLLREFGPRVGIQPNFSIFDDADQRALLREAVALCNLSTDNWSPAAAQDAISDAKNRMLTPAAFEQEAADFTSKTLARVYAEYQRLLTEQNGCDFDDLLMHVATLLGEHEDVRRQLSDRFRYLLIDEYQDTNHAQYLIANRLALAHRNICATGDPDQSIYAWRGADIQNILDFEADYPDAVTVRLEQNFRSTAVILSAAASLIAHNCRRKPKDLWTHDERGPGIRVWYCQDEVREARQIAEDIRAYCDSGGRSGDAAIFYRVNALSRVLEDALREHNLPYQIARGVEFYGRKEIKDALAYLRAIVNPADELSIIRAIGTPARGIGKTTIERLRAHARENGITIDQALAQAGRVAFDREGEAPAEPCGAGVSPVSSRTGKMPVPQLKSAAKKIEPFARLLAGLRDLPPRPVREIVEAVLQRSGLEAALRDVKDVDSDPLANVYELVSAAEQYDREHPDGGLAEWLHQISLVSDIDAVELTGGAVTLMTLHAAKGLEFPVVYIIGLEESLLPHRRAMRGDDSELEEERRLCFVGMTRAERKLTLSCAKYRTIRGIAERTVASRFLRELPAEEIESHVFDRDEDLSTAHLGRCNHEDASQEVLEFHPGVRVRHEEYGDGTVASLDRRGRSILVRVQFDRHGPHSFVLDSAPLTVIEGD